MRKPIFPGSGAQRPASAVAEANEPDENTSNSTQNRQHQSPLDGNQMSIIGADIVITGRIEASVDLCIEGKVIGDVRCASLILGETSSITGGINATRIKVSGTIDGIVETRDLALEPTARVSGEVTYARLRVANGGVIEGKLTRRTEGDERWKPLSSIETDAL